MAAKTINLALQGGGAHGAFTWGVLDKLLEDGRLTIDGLSGTSAGAMNAVVLSYHMMRSGNDGARTGLHDFWKAISNAGMLYNPVKPTPLDFLFGGASGHPGISYYAFDTFTKLASPYQFNPLNINPLKDVLVEHVDFDELQRCECTRMFISATNVRTNKLRTFRNDEITVDAVLASACLPMIFQAVRIDGEAYWDGGYMGNPSLYPLVFETDTWDNVIVHINPIETDEVPITPHAIHNRINEISFNSSLIRELRTISFAKEMADKGWIKESAKKEFRFADTRFHSIRADTFTDQLSLASKFNSDWNFLCELRDQGRSFTEDWLNRNYRHIGKKSTIDFQAEFPQLEDFL